MYHLLDVSMRSLHVVVSDDTHPVLLSIPCVGFKILSSFSTIWCSPCMMISTVITSFCSFEYCIPHATLYYTKTFRKHFICSDEIFPHNVWHWMLKANFKHAPSFHKTSTCF